MGDSTLLSSLRKSRWCKNGRISLRRHCVLQSGQFHMDFGQYSRGRAVILSSFVAESVACVTYFPDKFHVNQTRLFGVMAP